MFLLGRTGHALTVLRPAGVADIDGLRIDVITEGDFLDAGTPIIVSHVEGVRVVVEKCEAGQRERRIPAPDDGDRTAAPHNFHRAAALTAARVVLKEVFRCQRSLPSPSSC